MGLVLEQAIADTAISAEKGTTSPNPHFHVIVLLACFWDRCFARDGNSVRISAR